MFGGYGGMMGAGGYPGMQGMQGMQGMGGAWPTLPSAPLVSPWGYFGFSPWQMQGLPAGMPQTPSQGPQGQQGLLANNPYLARTSTSPSSPAAPQQPGTGVLPQAISADYLRGVPGAQAYGTVYGRNPQGGVYSRTVQEAQQAQGPLGNPALNMNWGM